MVGDFLICRLLLRLIVLFRDEGYLLVMFIENVIKVFDLGDKALGTRNFRIVFLRVCASIASIIRLESVSLRLSR